MTDYHDLKCVRCGEASGKYTADMDKNELCLEHALVALEAAWQEIERLKKRCGELGGELQLAAQGAAYHRCACVLDDLGEPVVWCGLHAELRDGRARGLREAMEVVRIFGHPYGSYTANAVTAIQALIDKAQQPCAE